MQHVQVYIFTCFACSYFIPAIEFIIQYRYAQLFYLLFLMAVLFISVELLKEVIY